MKTADDGILVLVHPGSACGSADFNLLDKAPPARDALAAEIMEWTGDMLVVDGALSHELEHYALLGLAITNAHDKPGRRVVRQLACDFTDPAWPDLVDARYREEWPGGPHRVVVTGAWYDPADHVDEVGAREPLGCVNAVARKLADQEVTISQTALRL